MNDMSRIKPHKIYMAVQYASNSRQLPNRAQLRRWISAALQRDARITLRIVDEPEGRKLNHDYRGMDYATNVLTFVYDDAEPPHQPPNSSRPPIVRGGVMEGLGAVALQPLHGDLVICAPVAEREAAAQHKDLLAHYAHLTIHAALHLQGYDHEDEKDAAAMESLETALMLKLRYPDPYQSTRH
jgi:probable rRNA maturation factor